MSNEVYIDEEFKIQSFINFNKLTNTYSQRITCLKLVHAEYNDVILSQFYLDIGQLMQKRHDLVNKDIIIDSSDDYKCH